MEFYLTPLIGLICWIFATAPYAFDAYRVSWSAFKNFIGLALKMLLVVQVICFIAAYAQQQFGMGWGS